MRKNYFDEPEQKEKQSKPQPFPHLWSIGWEEVTMACAKCKKLLVGFPFAFQYSQGQEFLSDGERIHKMILKTIADHSCTRDKSKISEDEMLSAGGITYEQYAMPIVKPQAPIEFHMNQWVININSGHIWQINNEADLATVIGGYVNGQRHILPYE